jgi:hypothetical protein
LAGIIKPAIEIKPPKIKFNKCMTDTAIKITAAILETVILFIPESSVSELDSRPSD